MIIGLLRCHLRLPYSHSLKEKRGIIKPLIHKLRTSHNCAVAEVDDNDIWQSAVLAMTTVYKTKAQTESLLNLILNELDNGEDFQLLEYQIEFL